MIDLSKLTIEQAHKDLLAKKYSAHELAQAYLDVIAAKNADINAFVEVYADALKQADAADALIAQGKATKLTGIPVAVKDNILVKGNIASAASAMSSPWEARQRNQSTVRQRTLTTSQECQEELREARLLPLL